ncbi:MAG TPA: chemotaxis protein CheW [Candidatus Acidoferrum sp.]|jgi:purine-binding chemotaxis protein CheW|nr:chemotaxis protein CheW [Candidatus Acidoferrum sp.]
MPEQKTGSHPGRGQDGGTEWSELHRRVEMSRSAMQQRLSPGIEERRTILRTRARFLAQERNGDKEPPQSPLVVVEFLLASEHYGIELTYIREIHALSEFTPLPGTPAFVLGLTNVRGRILSVIDIKKLFDLPEKGLTDLNKVIVVRTHQMELGILADAVLGVRAIGRNEFRTSLPTLTGIRAEYLKGITKDPLVVLDIATILSDERIVVNDGGNGAS